MGNISSTSQPHNKSGKKEAKAKLERAGKTGILSLSEHKLKEVPAGLLGLGEKLKTLDLSINLLQELPEDFSTRLPKIKSLKLSRNKLTNLPKSLGGSLVTLEVQDNQITTLDISRSLALEKLILARNPLGTIPKSVLSLPKLVTLDLTACAIANLILVDDKGEMSALLDLILDQNHIKQIPPSLLTRAPKLRRLSLQSNELKSFPSELLKSPSPLSALDLKGNLITKAEFLAIDGVDDFLQRREKTMKKNSGASTIADLSVCGLDE